MKDRIRDLAAGQVEYRRSEFRISPEEIIEKLNIDSVHRTEIVIEVTNNAQLKGVAYSSHSRVTVLTPTFFGRHISIGLEINTMGLSGQAQIEGAVTLVTNSGTRTISYYFDMQEKGYGAGGRVLHSIDDFADFVIDDEKAAMRLFKSANFMRLPFMRELNRQALYQTLSVDKNERRSLEEFLAYNKAKESLVYTVDSEPIVFKEITGDLSGNVTIRKNTWGYGILNISTDKPWLVIGESMMTTDAFAEDGTAAINFHINEASLGVGVNEGNIIITSARGEIKAPVTVIVNDKLHFSSTQSLEQKIIYAELLEQYIKYRVAIIENGNHKTELKNTIKLAEKMCDADPESWEKKLLLIYFRLIDGNIPGAEEYLDDVREEVMKNRLANNRAYCFFLYIRALYNESEEQLDTASKLIMKYYSENGQDPMLMLMLMRTDSSVRENQSLSVLRLKELYLGGFRSPLLYLEACENYRKAPDLLRVLNEFELQCLHFGARWGILSEDLAINAARVSSFENTFNTFTLKMLENIYDKYPRRQILENICSYLLRCGRKASEYFKWFDRGVRKELNIVGLYEAYIESLPENFDKPLPQAVLLYFAYSQDMRDDYKELIYENILKFYDNKTQVYREYADQMEEYAISQLLSGRISRKLVPLYRTLVYQEMIDQRLASVLPELMSAYEIRCSGKNLVKLVVRCPELNYEDSYELENGICYAPIYTEDSFIMFVDKFGNRYTDVPYEKELLFAQPELLKKCEEVYPDNLVFMVKRVMSFVEKPMKDEAEREPMEKLLLSAEVSEMFKAKIMSRLLDYCVSKDKTIGDEFLLSLDLISLSYHDRRKALECMVRSGHLDEVYEYISKNSVNGLKYDSLLKLAEYRLGENRGEYEPYLLNLALYLFGKKITTANLCGYLCKYFNGSNEEMRRLLFTCEGGNGNVYDLPERVIAQMMFSNDIEDLGRVFAIYRQSGNCKDMVVRAYHVMVSYEYFVNNRSIDDTVFPEIADILYGDSVNNLVKDEYRDIDIISIALLYYLTENENVLEKQNSICEHLLTKLVNKGLLFGFYSKLWNRVEVPATLNGKLLLEHRSSKASRVFLTMKRVDTDDEVTTIMQKMYDGVFVSQLVIFADETYEYGISEEIKGHVISVISRKLIADDLTFARGGSQFDVINEFARLSATKQDKQLEDAFVNYEKKQHIVASLFRTM
ncbi:MAG: DUF5717 family protein [Lachnospiraceae bacterium]|nr:DUF5717 family protein [Lachnospiraceae bacterium]